jgi:LCP family protein required for cell wall assembly
MNSPRRRYLLPGRRLWQRRAVAACLALVLLAAVGTAGVDAYAHWRFGQVTKVNLHQALRAPTAAEKTSENILIVGNNTRSGLAPQDAQLFGSPQEVGGARSDVTMVLHLDPARGTASLLSIPRDLFVPLPPHSMSGPVGKIDAALNDGPENLVKAITGNLGIPIDHYVSINFDGFQSVVNALGGIDLYFPTPLRDSLSGLNISQTGCQHLGGFQALAVVRARHLQYFADGTWSTDPLSDLGRIRRDQAFLRVLVHEAKTKGFDNPLRAQATIASVVHQVTIDSGFSFGEMLSLLRTYRGLNPDTVPTATLPISVALNYHWKGGAYGDVDMPAEPQDQAVIAAFLGTAPAVVAPAAVTLTITDMSGVRGRGTTVAGALRSGGFTVGGVTQTPAPGKPVETVIRYHPGSLADADAVLARLSGSVMLAADQSVPAGRVALDVGSDVAVAPLSPPAATTPTPSVRAPSPTPSPQASNSITPAHFSAQSYDPTACPAPGQAGR